jgi:hypothetical protein
MLGLVGEPGAAVLQARDPGLRIGRARPLHVGDPLAGAGAVELTSRVTP